MRHGTRDRNFSSVLYGMAYFVAQESDVSTGWVPFGFERRVSVVISASQQDEA